MHNQVDPQLEPGLELFPEFILTPETLLEVREMSVQMRTEMIAQAPKIEGVISEERRIPGPAGDPAVRIGIHTPANHSEKLPGFLWIHGGGYVMGTIDTDDTLTMPPLVKAVNCVAVTVDYRLAPEHPYPAPLEDCYAALKWMFDHADELGIDPTRIAIGGGSAGGGLAAGLALLVRDRAEMNIIYQLLVYPMIDDRNTKQASETLPDTLVWSRQHNLFGWTSYLGKKPGGDDVPIYAAAHVRRIYPIYRPPIFQWVIWTCSQMKISCMRSAWPRPACPLNCMSIRRPTMDLMDLHPRRIFPGTAR